ncbi:MAG: FHA domain-containing protein [Myxococcaceae bacterium]
MAVDDDNAPRRRPTRVVPKGQLPSAGEARMPMRSAAPRASSAGALLRGLTGPWLNQEHLLRGTMLVGRLPGSGIQVDDDSVSRRHAELEVQGAVVRLRDLGSANGTFLNGARVAGEAVLQPRDIVGFGVVEFEFAAGVQSDAVAEASAPTRRPMGRPARSALKSPRANVGGKRKQLLFLAAVFLVVGVGGGILYKRLKPRPTETASVGPSQAVGMSGGAVELEKALLRCRSSADTSAGREPDWDDALRQCNRYLDLNPLEPVANELVARIKSERAAAGLYERAMIAARQNREEEALDTLMQLSEDSVYFRRAQTGVDQIVKEVLLRTEVDCRNYARAGRWELALSRCEKHARLLCQNLPQGEREQPPGTKLALDGGRLPANEWRPKSVIYQTFLSARAKLNPAAGVWKCPEVKLLQKGTLAPEVAGKIAAIIEARVEAPALRVALTRYWEGKSEALRILNEVRNDATQAQLHGQADALRADVETVIQLFRLGESKLQEKDLKSALKSFQEAFAADERLLKGGTENYPSFYRRSMQNDFAQAAVELGKHYFNDRRSPPEACNVFRLGLSMYKGNTDLLVGVQRCTELARKAYERADSCEALEDVLKLAMDGDGFADKVAQSQKEMGCVAALDSPEDAR